MIIDPRGRIGGGPGCLDISDPRAPRLTATGRDFARTGPAPFRRSALWLIDGATRRGAERFAYTLQHKGYGPLIGANTAGAVMRGAPFLLPNGSLLYAALAALLPLTAGGWKALVSRPTLPCRSHCRMRPGPIRNCSGPSGKRRGFRPEQPGWRRTATDHGGFSSC